MQLSFHGAAQTVTGSRHLISLNGHRLLLDCGLYQGRRKETYERNLRFPFEPSSVDAVVLSHAHIDHSGNLPNMTRNGYEGPIYATQPTMHLVDLMTRDSGHIQESDAAYLNKKRARRGEEPIEPLYTAADAARAARQLVCQDYNQPFEPVPGAVATLVQAGHMLGSAGILLELEERGRRVRLMFSGDIGRPELPLMPDPAFPGEVDVLVMECTYGDRTHGSVQDAFEELQDVVLRTVKRGGKVIVPAFAVGRTQSIVYCLHKMIENGEVPEIPVFVDSPLAINVTAIFREHPEFLSEDAQAFMRSDPHGSAFGFDLLRYTLSVEESKSINEVKGPAVIISASGMAETGRILHHLKNHIENERNTILISSWMAPHTLGRRLLEGQSPVRIFGEEYEVRAEVARINGLSAHGSQPYLLEYAKAASDGLKQVYRVHGERRPAEALTEALGEIGITNVAYPEMGRVVEL